MMPAYRKPNPLAMALDTNESSPRPEARPNLPSPKIVRMQASELPEDVRVGDRICLSAFVNSMDSDGNVTVSVLRVVDTPEKQDQKIWVMPPESPVP